MNKNLPVTSMFDFKSNLRSLFTAPPGHLHPLDAWRTLAIFWIILEHIVMLLAKRADVSTVRAVTNLSELRPFFHASFGVDIFFVLSGFLIGGIIMREIDETSRMNWRRFYLRRILRMLPLYYFVLLMMIIGVRIGVADLPNVARAWANFLQVNNFMACREQFMTWTWSLAVEEQFYFVCPILLIFAYQRGKSALAPILFLIGAMVALHAVLVLKSETPLYWSIFYQIDVDAYTHYVDWILNKPYIRFSSLFIGVLGADFYRKGLVRKVFANRTGGLLLTILATLVLCSILSSMDYRTGHEAKGLMFEILYREAASSALLVLVFASLYLPAFKRIFSARIFQPFALLSYGAYLIHVVIAQLILDNFVEPRLALDFFTVNHVLVLGGAIFLLSLACTLPLYLFVEKPVMNWRKRLCS